MLHLLKIFGILTIILFSAMSCTRKGDSEKKSQSASLSETKDLGISDTMLLEKLESIYSSSFIDNIEIKRKINRLVSFQIASEPIKLDDAHNGHINYLKSSKAITKEGNDSIIHFLQIDGEDLKVLHEKGPNGARIYFCLESDKNLSLILVPIQGNEDNDLNNMFNKLDPCPDVCLKGKYTDLNNKTDLNYEKHPTTGDDRWYKPNLLIKGSNHNWVNGNNTDTRN